MKDFLRRSIGIFLGDYGSRTLLVSAGSSILNALIGAAKLVLGIVFFSPWLIVTGIYYLVLCAARGRILKIYSGIRRMNEEADREARQTALFRHSGFFICMIGLSYLGVCLCMYFWGEVVTYPPYLIYGVAAVAFYKIGMAIRGMIVTRKMHNPVLSTLNFDSEDYQLYRRLCFHYDGAVRSFGDERISGSLQQQRAAGNGVQRPLFGDRLIYGVQPEG